MPPIDGEEAGLGVEEGSDAAFACAQRAHQADFCAAFEDGCRHRRADGDSGCEQGGGGDEPHQAADAFEDGAFGLLDLADLLGVGAGDGFGDLVGDGVGVGAAVPDVVFLGREGVGVAAGEGVFGFGAGGDFDAGDGVVEDFAVESEKRLESLQVGELHQYLRCRSSSPLFTIPTT